MFACFRVCMACQHVSMCMYVCVLVFMFGFMHVYVACAYCRREPFLHAVVYACLHEIMYAYVHVDMYACVWMYLCMYVCLCVLQQSALHLSVCRSVCLFVCLSVCNYVSQNTSHWYLWSFATNNLRQFRSDNIFNCPHVCQFIRLTIHRVGKSVWQFGTKEQIW